ncbi:class I SAM-dependent methyltransferase [Algibacter amylolyticus]|uniref:Class I SAM-dependent methyltransferase n=1 Tax=Algibacter amylolyticus TaxID=1608400 RepID=A0A5M7B535_9FLAO|nr:class I SAM-dependent methyltransferase [Algibacter amylolyticus]KAA5823518.1 class I SAM-dependent methyltransferase [Algibacter amylolyticus]MBB5267670.1 ubiquinone/menaquinone biosynthesis C-methylase UbiE [Algibacter amylolyticus]TSJ74006.1 class I SAM-dependent methyltransferase [Algibacter amylolyticus]
MELNETKLNDLLGKVVTEMGAAANGPLVTIGDKLGLYKTLSESGAMSSQQLADATNTAERYIREWASAQAASGYINYDENTNTFSMSPEQTMVFGNAKSPVFMTGAFYAISSLYFDEPKLEKAFKTGDGVSWGDHNTCLFCGTEKFFSPSYEGNLIDNWLPSLDGVVEKLKQGAKVADIGCGHAASTIIMAKAFPNSTFVGYDYHEKSIEQAKERAKNAGVTNTSFAVAKAKDFPGKDYDFITFFDCLHDMGDPVGACNYVKKALKPDGTLMVVEPFANDSLQENLNPVGRAFYAFSTLLCVPCSLNQEVGKALGAQSGEKRLKQTITAGGFSRFKRATETPFNLILEARP